LLSIPHRGNNDKVADRLQKQNGNTPIACIAWELRHNPTPANLEVGVPGILWHYMGETNQHQIDHRLYCHRVEQKIKIVEFLEARKNLEPARFRW